MTFKQISDSIQPYLINIKKGVDVEDSFQKLLEAFFPIINYVVHTTKHGETIDDEDLFQQARLALWYCCDSYNMDSEASFYTYFCSCATRDLYNYVYGYQTPITLNRGERVRTQELRKFAKSFYEEYSENPTEQDYLDAGFEKYAVQRFMSISYMIANGMSDISELTNLADGSNITENYEVEDYKKHILDEIEALGELDSKIVKMRFYDEMKIGEIAKALGISYDMCRSHLKKAIQKLKVRLQNIGDYL